MEGYIEKKLASLLPIPAQDSNKYSRGKLTLFAGSALYPGAAMLAAQASQRSGAGYTEIFTAPSVLPFLQAMCPSLVVRSNKEARASDFPSFDENRPCAYVVGPGFDPEKSKSNILSSLILSEAKAPVLVDGGALQSLCSTENRTLCASRKERGYETVITPHWGEATKLAESFDLATDDPAQLAYALSLVYEATTVLKGSKTFVSDGEKVFSISKGTSALAKAGTGDVLSGIIGAFLAQGMSAFEAAVLGVTIHSKAGCSAEEKLTVFSVTAEDVIDFIPDAFKELLSVR